MSTVEVGHDHVPHGCVIGYVVVTWNHDGIGWRDDWDGLVHQTIDDGRESLRACSEASHLCYLGELRRVSGSDEGQS